MRLDQRTNSEIYLRSSVFQIRVVNWEGRKQTYQRSTNRWWPNSFIGLMITLGMLERRVLLHFFAAKTVISVISAESINSDDCVYWILLICTLPNRFLPKVKQVWICSEIAFTVQMQFLSCVFLVVLLMSNVTKCLPATSYSNGKIFCYEWEAHEEWWPILILYDLIRECYPASIFSAKLIIYLINMCAE